jgi:hypothetical protein
MGITEVPVIPFRAGRHLAAWIVWHTARVSWLDAADHVVTPPPPPYAKRRRKSRKR